MMIFRPRREWEKFPILDLITIWAVFFLLSFEKTLYSFFSIMSQATDVDVSIKTIKACRGLPMNDSRSERYNGDE